MFLYFFAVCNLKGWYESMRTRFGKISQGGKSGDGAQENTERDRWILEAFNFLSRHIVRIKTKVGVSVSIYQIYFVCTIQYVTMLSLQYV